MRDLFVRELPEISSEYFNFTAGRAIHRSDQMQQRGFAGAGRSHQGNKVALFYFDINFIERRYSKFIADILFTELASSNDYFAHFFLRWIVRSYCLISMRWPSFKSVGASTIRSSPPRSPLPIRTPCAVVPFTCTGTFFARPFKATNTLPLFTVPLGMTIIRAWLGSPDVLASL